MGKSVTPKQGINQSHVNRHLGSINYYLEHNVFLMLSIVHTFASVRQAATTDLVRERCDAELEFAHGRKLCALDQTIYLFSSQSVSNKHGGRARFNPFNVLAAKENVAPTT